MWCVSEDLAEYRLTFIQPRRRGGVYRLVARPVLFERVRDLQEQDPLAQRVQSRLAQGETLADWCVDADQYLLFGGGVYVPEAIREEILREFHNSTFAIHPGSTKMYRTC